MQTKEPIRCALYQMNPKVGDFRGNAEKILSAARKAADAGCSLLVTPEMSLVGYPAEDWLLRDDFCAKARAELQRLAEKLADFPDLGVLVGVPEVAEGHRFNSIAVLRAGRIEALCRKQHLPEYGVFDETRIFTPGNNTTVVTVEGVKVGLCICEDLWYPDVAQKAKAMGAEILVACNASPYEAGKARQRERTVVGHAAAAGLGLIYVNCTGGQDELIFDGASFVSDDQGTIGLRLTAFDEKFAVFETAHSYEAVAVSEETPESELYKALTLAVRDYVRKSGFTDVVLGLSGGIDSAVVAAVAVKALGAEHVHAVMMPTRFTADLSVTEAEKLASNLGIHYVVRPIEPLFAAFVSELSADFKDRKLDVTEENLQARIRGVLLMAYSNKFGQLVLTTGNKSETAVGYSTLYGDTAGAFAPIKDVFKTRVWALAREINREAGFELIPETIITRAPSAELREGQTDQDSLPDYAELDAILARYMEKREDEKTIARETGLPESLVHRIVTLVHRNEYKRRQSPPGPKVSALAFGRDWRFPITAKI